ncbi:MAG: hypothetical protein IT584_00585 [Chlamydiae bacterium]|nr:hypothetical protein [Chlamydiota bacterium]
MAAAKNVDSSSSFFEMKFPAFPEISRPTRRALAALSALSIAASVYGVVRKMDARTFSIEALTTAQKVASGAFFALSLLFAASAALCPGAKAEKVKDSKSPDKAEGSKSLPEIPFKDQVSPWFMRAIEASGRSYRFVSFNEPVPAPSEFEGMSESIVFFTAPVDGAENALLQGIYLKLQATNSQGQKLAGGEVCGILHKQSDNPDSTWTFILSSGLASVFPDDRHFHKDWKLEPVATPPKSEDVFDIDTFEKKDDQWSLVDGMLDGLLRKGCRTGDWELSLAPESSASSSS